MKRLSGRARMARNRRILAQSDVCHICGHSGSDAVDHVNPFVVSRDESPANLRPAHHAACPTCGRKCNLEKSDKPHAPIVRRSGSLSRPQAPAPPPA